ncbi:GNAT family N-acetyltransferase [Candidatus Woesebacteria bacterium]|nr:GNAT family N-acetyltransferase [Candidatus Woesebacteria bacterium]
MHYVSDLKETDIPALREFIAKQFHHKYILLHEVFFDWQYLHAPWNKPGQYSMKVIKHREEVLGYCGYVPLRFLPSETPFLAAVLANLIVDERLRRFGFGIQLLQAVTADYPVTYVNGYSDQLRSACSKWSQWSERGNLNRLVGVLHREKFDQLGFQIKNLSQLTYDASKSKKLTLVHRFTKSFDERLNDLFPFNALGVARTSQYLNWRYIDHPLFNYECYTYGPQSRALGYVVIRKEPFAHVGNNSVVARILEYGAVDSYSSAMLGELHGLLYDSSVDFIDFFCSMDVWNKQLGEMGYLDISASSVTKLPVLFSPVDTTRKAINWMTFIDTSRVPQQLLDTTDPWYLTKGDGDQDRPNIQLNV